MKRIKTIPMKFYSIKTTLFYFIIFLCSQYEAVAQQEPVLQQKYSFNATTLTVNELATQIQKQSDISISFDSKNLNGKTKVVLPKRTLSSKELAGFLQTKYNIKTKFIGRHMLLQRTGSLSKQKRDTKSNRNKTNAKPKEGELAIKPSQQAIAIVSKTHTVELTPINIHDYDFTISFSDSLEMNDSAASIISGGISVSQRDSLLNTKVDKSDDPMAKQNLFDNFALSYSMKVDEYFYVNPTLQLHYKNLFVLGTYAFRVNQSHFRYGIGYNFPVNEKISLSIWADYGMMKNKQLQKNFSMVSIDTIVIDTFTTIYDTLTIDTSYKYNLNGNLFRVGLNANWHMTNRLDLFGGITFNYMNVNIFNNEGLKSSPNQLFDPQVQIEESDFYILPKRFELNNTFKPSLNSFSKQWLGFQIGLRYYIFRKKE